MEQHPTKGEQSAALYQGVTQDRPPRVNGAAPRTPGAPRSRPLADILADLAKPIPPRLLKTKKVPKKNGGGYEATYTHHTTIRDLLDFYAPGWEWRLQVYEAKGLLYVIGTLTLHGADGSVSRDGVGNEDSELDGFGDPSSNAEAQALRRAAMAHGLGRDLWKK
jgi:hypothetical protein